LLSVAWITGEVISSLGQSRLRLRLPSPLSGTTVIDRLETDPAATVTVLEPEPITVPEAFLAFTVIVHVPIARLPIVALVPVRSWLIVAEFGPVPEIV